MLKRTISGACYTAVVVLFFLLKEYVDSRLFSLLIWFCCSVGTFEIARALSVKTGKASAVINVIYGVCILPVYLVSEYVFKTQGYLITIITALIFIIIQIIASFFSSDGIKALLLKCFPLFYPAAPFVTMLMTSLLDGNKALIGLLLIFVVSALTDTLAYLVGMIYSKIKKGETKKLCPKLSPKKTWAGAIGGLFGGIVGALLVYFIFNSASLSIGLPYPLICFALLGFIGGIFTQVGDLFESAIKRYVGIKDMGKIMPGHGGILDRFDGMLFVSVIVFVTFILL